MTRSRPWVDPPPPLGRKGERYGGGWTADGQRTGDLGDAVELALVREFGWERTGNGRMGAFDLQDGSDVYEVKAVTRQSIEYKCKPKAAEVAAKLAYAHENDVRPHMLIAVVDGRRVWAYAKEGVRAYRLPVGGRRSGPEKGWTFLGTARLAGR